jgi:hypothetical protein
MAASLVREDAPWLYELALEVYRAAKSGDAGAIENEVARLRRFSEMMMRGPLMEEFGFGGRESHMLAMEFPRIMEHALRRDLQTKAKSRRKTAKPRVQEKDI